MGKYFVIFLLFLVACSERVSFDNVSFDVELAQTPAERSKGLMSREFLPENQGMLFIFDSTAPRSFWMKNTLIPLDMIFVDENFSVVDVKTAEPCKAEPCQAYSASARYILEINAGLAEKNGIKVGSLMSRK